MKEFVHGTQILPLSNSCYKSLIKKGEITRINEPVFEINSDPMAHGQ